MAFSEVQMQALSGKLSAKHVRTRQANGRTLSYIEGWQCHRRGQPDFRL